MTSFVTMALAGADQKHHPVVPRAVAFLHESVREDGSWPIDTNLATWGTTLAIKALTVSSMSVSRHRCRPTSGASRWGTPAVLTLGEHPPYAWAEC